MPANAPYLQLISFIAVIASTVQLVEMFIKKFSPTLFRALGIFLPLITTNCAILAVALFQSNRQYSFIQSFVFALGAGVGFTLALALMAGLREKLEFAADAGFGQRSDDHTRACRLVIGLFHGFCGTIRLRCLHR